MRWRLGGVDELRMHVTKEAPRSVVVKVGDRDVPVVPLADLELAFPDIRRVMDRWRAIGDVTERQPGG
jgi:hypothetical protein